MIGWTPAFAMSFGEFERGKEVAGVGQRHRRHAGPAQRLGERLDLDRAFEERIGGVDPQVDEARLGHRRRP